MNGRSYRFSHAICRVPAPSVSAGLRAVDGGDPDPDAFLVEHAAYVEALRATGADVLVLEAEDDFPDSVFVEDAALCLAGQCIAMRPGAPTRRGEVAAIRPALEGVFGSVLDLEDGGFVEGGDVLVSDGEVFAGLSARTDRAGVAALEKLVVPMGYRLRLVQTPPEILHFKTECSLLDSGTIFATARLAATGCFEGYRVIEVPEVESAAANAVRFNEAVLLSAGHPKSAALLSGLGYNVVVLDTYEAAKVDGGLSCMSLRFSI